MRYFIFLVLFFIDSSYSQIGEFSGSSVIQDPINLRDPFKPPKRAIKDKKSSNALLRGGVYTNVGSSTTLPLESIKVSGVILGERNRAILITDLVLPSLIFPIIFRYLYSVVLLQR